MSAFHADHVSGLCGLAELLLSESMVVDLPVVLTEAVKAGPTSDSYPENLSRDLVQLLMSLRMGVAFLIAFRRMEADEVGIGLATACCVDKMVDC